MDIEKTYSFITNSLEYAEIGTKSKKEYTVKGYISTNELDRANEVVSDEAMSEMLTQIKSGNVKLDVEHSTFVGENDIPVGRIIDAGIDTKGLWVEAVLNKGHEKFKSVWSSIKDGFLDAFSIAYKVKSSARALVNGVEATILKSLELLNVAITGNPVNKGAKMTESFYKSLRYNNQGDIMTEQTKVKSEEAPEAVAPVVEEKTKVEEPVVEPAKEVVEEPAKEEPAKEEPAKEEPVIEKVIEPTITTPSVQEVVAEALVQPLDAIKSLNKELAQLKSLNAKLEKKLEEPQLKGFGSTNIAEVKEDTVQIKNVLDSI